MLAVLGSIYWTIEMTQIPRELFTEIFEIISIWICHHHRFSVINDYLLENYPKHKMLYLGLNGRIYSQPDKDGISVEYTTLSSIHYTDPQLLSKIELIMDIHVADCDICKLSPIIP